MDRSQLFGIAHRRHPIAAPVAPERLRDLVGWLAPPAAGRAVDLGCGEGEWLQELLLARPGLTGVGIDHVLPASAAERTAQRGLGDQVRWIETDAATWSDGLVDVVLCVGASHAFGRSALAALEASPDDFPDLAGLVRATREHGFEPAYGHTSTLAEWDDDEFSWTGSLVDWALREAPTAEDRDQALAAAREHREGWLGGWRGELGFATPVLHDVATTPEDRSG